MPHSDPAREGHVPLGELARAVKGLLLGLREQVGHALSCDPDHRTRPPAPAAAASHGCGCWHTGQYTAGWAITVRHRTQYFPLGGGGIGPTAPCGIVAGIA